MVRVHLFGMIKKFIEENLWMVNYMEKDKYNLVMDKKLKENGLKVKIKIWLKKYMRQDDIILSYCLKFYK